MTPPHSNLNFLAELGFSPERIQTIPEHYASNPDQALDYLLRQPNAAQTASSSQWPGDSQKEKTSSSSTPFDLPPGPSATQDPSQRNNSTKSSSHVDEATPLLRSFPPASTHNRQTEDEQMQEAIRISKQEYDRNSLGVAQPDGIPLLLEADQNDIELQRALAESAREQKAGNMAFEDEDPRKRKRESLLEPVGLCNIGNTCYLNSLLQLYFHLDDFRRSILSFTPPARPDTATKNQQPQTEQKPSNQSLAIDFVIELQRLFASMALGNQKFANPKNLFQVMQKCIDNVSLGNQEDAQEYGLKLLELAEKAVETPIVKDKPTTEDPKSVKSSEMNSQSGPRADVDMENKSPTLAATQSASSHVCQPRDGMQQAQNFVKSIFTLKVRFEMKLDPQGKQQEEDAAVIRRTKPDGVLSSYPGHEPSVLISINGLADQNIYDGLDDFTHQTLDYRYNRDNEQPVILQAIKRMFITSVPPVLTVWLKRHTFNRESGAGKAETRFLFHEEIALDRYLSENREEADKIRTKVRSIQRERASLKNRLDSINRLGLTGSPGSEEKQISPERGGEDMAVALKRVAVRLQCSTREENRDLYIGGIQENRVQDAVSLLQTIIDNDHRNCTALQRQIDSLDAAERSAYSTMENSKYQLQAVLIHEGAGSGGGHYWTYIRDRSSGREAKRWIKFNDRIVSYVDEAEMWNASLGGKGHPSSAYCIAYVRCAPDNTERESGEQMEIVREDIADEASHLLPAELVAEVLQQNTDFLAEIEAYKRKLATTSINDVARRLLSEALGKVKAGTTPLVPMTASSNSVGGSQGDWKDFHSLEDLVFFLLGMGSPALALAQALVDVWNKDSSVAEVPFFECRVEDIKAMEFPALNDAQPGSAQLQKPSQIQESLIKTIQKGPGSENWPPSEARVVAEPVCLDLGHRLQNIAGIDSLITDLKSYEFVYYVALCSIKLQGAALDASLKGDWMNAIDFWYIVFRCSFTAMKVPRVPPSAMTKAASIFRNDPSLEYARTEGHHAIFMAVLVAASEHAVALLMEQNEEGIALGMKAARLVILFSMKTEMTFKAVVQLWEQVSVRWANDPRQALGHKAAGDILKTLNTADNSVSVNQTGLTPPDVVEKAKILMEDAAKDPAGTVKEYEHLLDQMLKLNPHSKDANELRRVAERIRLNVFQFDG